MFARNDYGKGDHENYYQRKGIIRTLQSHMGWEGRERAR